MWMFHITEETELNSNLLTQNFRSLSDKIPCNVMKFILSNMSLEMERDWEMRETDHSTENNCHTWNYIWNAIKCRWLSIIQPLFIIFCIELNCDIYLDNLLQREPLIYLLSSDNFLYWMSSDHQQQIKFQIVSELIAPKSVLWLCTVHTRMLSVWTVFFFPAINKSIFFCVKLGNTFHKSFKRFELKWIKIKYR